MDYSEKVRFIRQRLLLTQKELAEKLDVAFATVNRWEKGHIQPSIRYKREIEKLYSEAKEVKYE